MLFARWQHHLWFCSGFPYAPLKAMVTKISKWSRIQDSFQITLTIESSVVFAIPDMPLKFQKDPSITFWVILLTHRQTDRQTNKVWQKHYLLGGCKYFICQVKWSRNVHFLVVAVFSTIFIHIRRQFSTTWQFHISFTDITVQMQSSSFFRFVLFYFFFFFFLYYIVG